MTTNREILQSRIVGKPSEPASEDQPKTTTSFHGMKWTKIGTLPFSQGYYWVYLPSMKLNNGTMLTYFDGKNFEMGDYKGEITYWLPLTYPRPPFDVRPR